MKYFYYTRSLDRWAPCIDSEDPMQRLQVPKPDTISPIYKLDGHPYEDMSMDDLVRSFPPPGEAAAETPKPTPPNINSPGAVAYPEEADSVSADATQSILNTLSFVFGNPEINENSEQFDDDLVEALTESISNTIKSAIAQYESRAEEIDELEIAKELSL
jgi:hypothetical protein